MTNYTLENVGVGTELDKRFSLENTKLEKRCDCGHIMVKDLEDDYLSYPSVGYPESIYMYCDECDTEYEDALKVTVRVNLDIEEL